MTRCSSTPSTCLRSRGDKLPLHMRRTNLVRLVARRVDGIFLSDVEQGEIGPDAYRQSSLAPVKPALERAHEEQYQHDGRSYDQDYHVACHTLLCGLGHG